MIIDLAGSGFLRLQLVLSLEADYNEVGQAWEAEELPQPHRSDTETHYLVLARFRKGTRTHTLIAALDEDNEDGTQLTLSYGYGEGRIPREYRSNVDKLGRMLDNLAAPCSVMCFANGEFSTDRLTPVVGLPLLRFGTPQLHFDEIRGIRLVKLEGDVERDSVFADLQPEGVLWLSVQTTYTTTASSVIPADALKRLTRLKAHACEALPAAREEE